MCDQIISLRLTRWEKLDRLSWPLSGPEVISLPLLITTVSSINSPSTIIGFELHQGSNWWYEKKKEKKKT